LLRLIFNKHSQGKKDEVPPQGVGFFSSDADIQPGLPECGRVMYVCYKDKSVFIASLHFHKIVCIASLHFVPPWGEVF